MQDFIESIHQKAKDNPKKIVFPETQDTRILEALETIVQNKIAYPIVLEEVGIDGVEVVNKESDLYTQMVEDYIQILKEKDEEFNEDEAREKAKEPNYLGTLLVNSGHADGMVTGAMGSTADSIRPALEIIPTKEKFQRVSGAFLMKLDERVLFFADAAITIEPEAHDLVDIAEDTVETARDFGIEPKVAFLSFSTKGSAHHPLVQKVARAAEIFSERHPDIISEGEMQADAALVPEISQRKFSDSRIKGDANILIFPDLNSANIAYKLVERLAKSRAVGPILQGLTKPINDLSRGCSVKDIIDLTAITVVEAQN